MKFGDTSMTQNLMPLKGKNNNRRVIKHYLLKVVSNLMTKANLLPYLQVSKGTMIGKQGCITKITLG